MSKLGLGSSIGKESLTTPAVISTGRTLWRPFDSRNEAPNSLASITPTVVGGAGGDLSWNVISNTSAVVNVAGDQSWLYWASAVPTTAAKYILSYTLNANGSLIQLSGGSSAFSGHHGTDFLPRTNGTHQVTVTSNGSQTGLLISAGSSFVGTISDVSLRRIESYTGQALEFDGVGDYFSLPSIDLNDDGDFTFAVWLNLDSFNSSDGFTGGHIISGPGGFQATIYSTYLRIDPSISAGGSRDFTHGMSTGNWYRVVYTQSGLSGKLYVNGVLTDSETQDNQVDSGTNYSGYFSKRHSSNSSHYITGKASDLQMWDIEWTASDVTYDYLNPEKLVLDNPLKTIPMHAYSNLLCWYPMQDGTRGSQINLMDGANTGKHVIGTSDGGTFTGSNPSIYPLDANGNQIAKVVGQAYEYTWTITESTSGTGIKVFPESSTYVNAVGTYTETWIATSTAVLRIYVHGFVGKVSNVSVSAVNLKNHGTSTFHGDEILSNTGFETLKGGESGNTAGTVTDLFDNWTVALGGSSTVEADTDVSPQAGTYACKMTYNGGQSYIYQDATVVSGRNYTLTFYVRGDGSKSGHIRVHKTTGGDYIAEADIGQTAASWSQKTYTFTADANGDVRIRLLTDTATSSVWFDEVSFKETGFATGWTDADAQPTIPQLGFQSYNQLAWFTAADDLVDINADTSLASGSYSFWAISNRTSGKNLIFGHGHEYSGVFAFNWSSNRPILRIGANKYVMWDDTSAQDDGNWHHWVVYMDADDVTDSKLYVDGVLQAVNATANTGLSQAYGEGLNIGAEKASSPSHQFEGCITEFSWWNKELSLAEAQELYNDGEALDATLHSSAANLSGYWRNRGTGTWTDLSTNSNNGTPTSVSEYLILPEGNNGRDTQGFLMNRGRISGLNNPSGSDSVSYIDVGSTTISAGDAYSIMTWLKPSDVASNGFIGLNGSHYLYILNSTSFRVYHDGVNKTFTVENGAGAALAADVWVHVAFVRNTSNLISCYVNGVLNGGATTDTETLAEPFSYQYIGGKHTTDTFRGIVDDMAIYNTELSATQVARNYKAGKRRHKN